MGVDLSPELGGHVQFMGMDRGAAAWAHPKFWPQCFGPALTITVNGCDL